MIIERFRPGKVREMYLRFADKGRMLPDGVKYIDSWINEPVTVCYQVMEAASVESLQVWIDNWKDLVDFEIVPVISSAEAKAKVFAE
ncbi:MAG: DUF3303 domain-containing protein [Chitinophagales bacterium]